jgi:hypothetical protein
VPAQGDAHQAELGGGTAQRLVTGRAWLPPTPAPESGLAKWPRQLALAAVAGYVADRAEDDTS